MKHTHTHTQGPWALNPANLCEIASNGNAIAHIYRTASCESYLASECRANARLIAAAPDLLAALENLLDCAVWAKQVLKASEESHYSCCIIEARAAIAKATGQA